MARHLRAATFLLGGLLLADAAAKPAEKIPKAAERAIQDGVRWLKADAAEKMQPAKKAQPGSGLQNLMGQNPAIPYLEGLALVHAGLPASDPLILSIWKQCAAAPHTQTYDLSLRLMFSEALVNRKCKGSPAPEAVREWMKGAANALASWCAGGIWTYSDPRGYQAGAKGKGYKETTTGYPETPERGKDYSIGNAALKALQQRGYGDFSNAQYAVLGLKAAALCGVRPDNADLMWRVTADLFLSEQEPSGPDAQIKVAPQDPDFPIAWLGGRSYKPTCVGQARGWGYMKGQAAAKKVYGSMTSCGLGALLVARSEIRDLSPQDAEKIDRGIRDGVLWLAAHFAVDKNPYGERCDSFSQAATYYHLYGLERTGMLANLRELGGHDWYREGCDYLLKNQKPDGSWPTGEVFENAAVRTSFALLFLARATSARYAAPYRGADIGEEIKPDAAQDSPPPEEEPSVVPLPPPEAPPR